MVLRPVGQHAKSRAAVLLALFTAGSVDQSTLDTPSHGSSSSPHVQRLNAGNLGAHSLIALCELLGLVIIHGSL